MAVFDGIPEIMTTKELAEFLKCSERKVRLMREKGTGPAWFEDDGIIRYLRPTVEVWVFEQQRTERKEASCKSTQSE